MVYNTIWYKNSFRPLQNIDYYYYSFLHSNTELIKLFLPFSLILEFMKYFYGFHQFWNSSKYFPHFHIFYNPSKHCVKIIRIRSYSGPYIPAFGLNTVRMRENTDQNNSEYEHYWHSETFSSFLPNLEEFVKIFWSFPSNLELELMFSSFSLSLICTIFNLLMPKINTMSQRQT